MVRCKSPGEQVGGIKAMIDKRMHQWRGARGPGERVGGIKALMDRSRRQWRGSGAAEDGRPKGNE